jgi:hypothetical protein
VWIYRSWAKDEENPYGALLIPAHHERLFILEKGRRREENSDSGSDHDAIADGIPALLDY